MGQGGPLAARLEFHYALPDGGEHMPTEYCLGDWFIRPRLNCIERGDDVIHLQPKPMAVLQCLAEAGGEVVTRDTLFEAVWPGQIVSDAALTQCIVELRRAFGDSAHEPQIIRTVPKVGFCLIPPVQVVADDGEPTGGDPSRRFPQRIRPWLLPGAAVAVVVIAAFAMYDWGRRPAPEGTVAVSPAQYQRAPSIAVLPFADMSEAGDQGYFADGLSEELLSRLAQVPGLRVIARQSSFAFRDKDLTVPQIALKLDVSHVLEGAVRKSGDHLRISAELVRAADGSQLWSRAYDRTLEDVFAIQSEIAAAVAGTLQARLSPAVQQRISITPTNNLEAYDAYLLGWQRLMQRNSRSLAEALEYMQRAVELDGQFAAAWAGLARAYELQPERGLEMHKMLAKTSEAARRALELDPRQALAHTMLGVVQARSGAAKDAEQSFKRAIEFNPNGGDGYYFYGLLLEYLGRWDEAREMITIAVKLDPMNGSIRFHHAVWLRRDGRFDEALRELATVLEFEPEFVMAQDASANIQRVAFNRYAEAALGFAKALELDSRNYGTLLDYADLYLELGDPDRAARFFERAKALVPRPNWQGGGWMLDIYRGDSALMAEQFRTQKWKCENDITWVSQLNVAQLRNETLAAGRYEEALSLYSDFCPALLTEPEPVVDYRGYRAAIDLALVLQKTGNRERADMLLDRAQAFIQDKPRLGYWGGYWISDVQILALQGRKREALAALRRAVDEGWRTLWWYYDRYDPNLDPIRDEPGFQAAMDDIRADMAAQLEEIRELERSGELPPISELLAEPTPDVARTAPTADLGN